MDHGCPWQVSLMHPLAHSQLFTRCWQYWIKWLAGWVTYGWVGRGESILSPLYSPDLTYYGTPVRQQIKPLFRPCNLSNNISQFFNTFLSHIFLISESAVSAFPDSFHIVGFWPNSLECEKYSWKDSPSPISWIVIMESWVSKDSYQFWQNFNSAIERTNYQSIIPQKKYNNFFE